MALRRSSALENCKICHNLILYCSPSSPEKKNLIRKKFNCEDLAPTKATKWRAIVFDGKKKKERQLDNKVLREDKSQ